MDAGYSVRNTVDHNALDSFCPNSCQRLVKVMSRTALQMRYCCCSLAADLCDSSSVKLMPAAPAESAASDEKASMLLDSTGEPCQV
jgi:hypothetical protein